jgi:hypothetical protein
MSNEFGTDRRSLQNTTGSLQDDDGTPLLSTDTWGSASYALGPALATGIYTGVQNGIFSSPPSNVGTATPITDLNPLPYFSISDASSGRITAAAVEDTSQASGYAIRFTIGTAATTPDKITLKRLVSVSSSRAQSYSYVFRNAWSTATAAAGSTTAFITGSAKYIAADGTTVVGGTSTTGDVSFADLPTYGNGREIDFVPNGNGIIPSTASYLAIEIGVNVSASSTAVRTVDLYECRIDRGQSNYRIVADDRTNGTVPYGDIFHDGTATYVYTENYIGGVRGIGYLVIDPTSTRPTFEVANMNILASSASTLTIGGTSTIVSSFGATSPQIKYTGINLSLWQGGASGDIDFKDSAGSAFLTVNNAKNVVLQANGGYRQVGPPTTTQTSSANIWVLTSGTTYEMRRNSSSRRYKTNIVPTDAAVLEAAKKIRAVHYESTIPSESGVSRLGFIAEEIESAGLTHAVSYNGEGQVETIDPVALIAALLVRIEDLDARLQEIESDV